MDRRPFSTFRDELVARFAHQVEEAWAETKLPFRNEAVPHHCSECDELWEWIGKLPGKATRELRVSGWYFWELLGPKGVVYVLGRFMLTVFSGSRDAWSPTDLPMTLRLDKWFKSHRRLEAFNARQRWCLLKMMVWSYLENPSEEVYEAIIRTREKMGFRSAWPRPKPHPQT